MANSGGTNAGHGGKGHGGKKGKHKLPTLEELLGLGDNNQPPFLAYDPAIEAERRAAARGLLDVLRQNRTDIKRARQDKRTSIRDSKVSKKRTISDIRTQKKEGLQDIGFQRQDVKRESERGFQDFAIQMQNLTRSFGRIGSAQSQAANAAGLGADSGTLAASAAKRKQNLAIASEPIDLARARLGEDTTTQLGRLDVEQSRLLHQARLGARRTRSDFRHDKRLTIRDFQRQRHDVRRQGQVARREQTIGNVDLINQEIFDARSRHPGVYGKAGRRKKGH